jgi:hypothetical protein
MINPGYHGIKVVKMFAPDPIQEKRGYSTRIKWDISVRFKNVPDRYRTQNLADHGQQL